ncbi:hypothetical protein [Lunatibacter salilacus]|uniref:hypothetical protein n=1 Tax=Lunatibacter salilacus TaxID=2483804 RepID=UPI00131BC827|nr:hypothetical protein [Lunatibacter salilacus]
MSTISAEELAQYLASKGPLFQTSNSLSIYVNGDHISSEYKFEVEQMNFSFCLFTEEDNLIEFIDGFRIKNLDDLEELGYKNIWIRYLIREADMEVTELEIEETPINFRLHKMKTMVFCAASHYYDEVYAHLTLPEDFIRYFHENQKKLQVAFANRYKF